MSLYGSLHNFPSQLYLPYHKIVSYNEKNLFPLIKDPKNCIFLENSRIINITVEGLQRSRKRYGMRLCL